MLAELQRDFARAVRGDAMALPRVPVDPAGLSAERRIAVYRNHHRISLGAALAANFPTAVKVVGEEALQALALSYLAIDPPRDACLVSYGAGFPAFLESDPRSQSLVYLGDVARLDLALNRADQAADAASFTPSRLAALDEGQLAALVVAPHPSMALLRSPYPLLRIRALAQQPEAAGGVSLNEGGVRLMIWRRDEAAFCASLDYQTDAFVAALAAGTPLGDAAKQIDPAALPNALACFVLSGAFVATS
jgi:hypothetical protein